MSIQNEASIDRSVRALEHANLAKLVHSTDDGVGIARRKRGEGFRYFGEGNSTITDTQTLDRIRSLAIPPAWSDVWISDNPDGHLQATGIDTRGRKQYRYHPRWREVRDQAKFETLPEFARALPDLRSHIETDLRRRGLTQERVVASIIWLMDHTMIRIGNAAYSRDNKSFGLSTLRDRHVKIDGDRLKFLFRGKSGKTWNIELLDRRIARIVRSSQDLPGQDLFQYLDPDGNRHRVSSQDVNHYIKQATGADFTSKNFRTWGGTTRALWLFGNTPLPDTKTAQTRTANLLIDSVAQRLGNTRTVCRKCYIHPDIPASWLTGDLETVLSDRAPNAPIPTGLDAEEALAMHWLARQ